MVRLKLDQCNIDHCGCSAVLISSHISCWILLSCLDSQWHRAGERRCWDSHNCLRNCCDMRWKSGSPSTSSWVQDAWSSQMEHSQKPLLFKLWNCTIDTWNIMIYHVNIRSWSHHSWPQILLSPKIQKGSKGWSLRSRGDGQTPFGDSQTLDVE